MRTLVASLFLLAGCHGKVCAPQPLDAEWESRKGLIPPGFVVCEVVSGEHAHLILNSAAEDAPREAISAQFLVNGYLRNDVMRMKENIQFQGADDAVGTNWNRERNGVWRVVYNLMQDPECRPEKRSQDRTTCKADGVVRCKSGSVQQKRVMECVGKPCVSGPGEASARCGG